MVNKVIIRPETRIGNMSAETDDEFLFECFEDHPALATISDISSPKMFLLGGTGSGKTAIIRMLEKNNRDVESFNIHEIAMSYIANNDVIQFLEALDVPLDYFFQALWRHVICIEYIRLSFRVDSADKSKGIFNRIFDRFSRDDRKSERLII